MKLNQNVIGIFALLSFVAAIPLDYLKAFSLINDDGFNAKSKQGHHVANEKVRRPTKDPFRASGRKEKSDEAPMRTNERTDERSRETDDSDKFFGWPEEEEEEDLLSEDTPEEEFQAPDPEKTNEDSADMSFRLSLEDVINIEIQLADLKKEPSSSVGDLRKKNQRLQTLSEELEQAKSSPGPQSPEMKDIYSDYISSIEEDIKLYARILKKLFKVIDRAFSNGKA